MVDEVLEEAVVLAVVVTIEVAEGVVAVGEVEAVDGDAVMGEDGVVEVKEVFHRD